jgi:putative sigma-54 modulation protein
VEVVVRGKNLEVTDSVRDYVTRKLAKLERFFHNIIDAVVHFYLERGLIKVEVTMSASGIVIRGESNGPDWRTAFDAVIDKLERQIKKHKEKLKKKGALRKEEVESMETGEFAFVEPEKEASEPGPGEIVKTKEFVLRPMSLEDAILQMEFLGHNFFVFKDLDEQRVKVVYKRKDGNYGLIDLVY